MGNALAMQPTQIIIEDDDPLMRDYKKATVKDYHTAKDNFDTLQETVGDKMTVTPDEFDEIFSLICQDPSEHFALFDCWELGKVDVMEVFAVVIVYCKAPIEAKIPLLFDLFDFDHSQEISQHELVLLMLCTTRGLCKVIGLDRPGTEDLEALATSAFVSIDRDQSGAISLPEFADWALQEPSLMVYLKRFASTRLIYEDQLAYDALLQHMCSSFVQFAVQAERDAQHRQQRQLACSAGTCRDVITRHCPSTTAPEADYLVRAMQETMERTAPSIGVGPGADDAGLPHMVTLEVFCLVCAPYAAFVVADDDKQHVLSLQELLVLLWLLRGKEPSAPVVDSYMRSLDRDRSGALSALEWVSYAVESDARTGGSLSFATQVQLLFTSADRNGDAVLSLHELGAGLKPIVLQALVADEMARVASAHKNQDASASASAVAVLALEKQLAEHSETIAGLLAGLANELMLALDQDASHRIEWVEFRPQLDFLETRVRETTAFIRDFVLP
ncbi:hypothetical protein PybrP1_001204 [[Pythium] brassicae (nom. inval.)]|nr:hypothetical protein PybrP1_001204 [[Pythium] brassicae (nom. inval.)]